MPLPSATEYVLGEKVFFSVQEATLLDKKQCRTVKLQRPASRCLELLIQHHGTLVSQKMLMDYGWGDERAKYNTLNAFYQSMYHLRQSLEQVGLADVIYTVARQGSGLRSTLNITPVTASESQSENVKSIPSHNPHNWRIISGLTIAVFIILCSMIFLMWPFPVKHNDIFFKNHSLKSLQQCQIYRSPPDMSDEKVYFLLQRSRISCQQKMTIFISSIAYGERNSLIACQIYNDKKRQCLVYFIMDHFDEKIAH